MRMMYVVMRMCKPIMIVGDWGKANAFMEQYRKTNYETIMEDTVKRSYHVSYCILETPFFEHTYQSLIPYEKQPEFYRHLLRDVNIFGIWRGLRIVLARCLQSHELNLLLLKEAADRNNHIRHLEDFNQHLLKLLKENNINVDI